MRDECKTTHTFPIFVRKIFRKYIYFLFVLPVHIHALPRLGVSHKIPIKGFRVPAGKNLHCRA